MNYRGDNVTIMARVRGIIKWLNVITLLGYIGLCTIPIIDFVKFGDESVLALMVYVPFTVIQLVMTILLFQKGWLNENTQRTKIKITVLLILSIIQPILLIGFFSNNHLVSWLFDLLSKACNLL